MTNNLTWHSHTVTPQQRSQLKGHGSALVWFTGLSGSGKSTLANALERRLLDLKVHSFLLDGDNVRLGLNGDLGFGDEDRVENIRRIGEVGKLFVASGTLCLSAFISPFREDRDRVRAVLAPGQFIEVFVDAPLAVCEQRDPKGLYRRARAGEIAHFTGIDSDYEAPERPEIHIRSDQLDTGEAVEKIIAYLRRHGVLRL
ncbi:adenylyl-sulfate kinase [Ferrimonas sediminicola]|uniref:Adenylyl-sulfate kinase n=1 Tax=Ferrimonas sediminicola TaxID=2569538 RepID=A0A4U1BFF4_9GAMM|nr:adenylyl-sulfate kinase [Ferrimonas sediminicola]TKB49994.1 adenylyl-sulfate kinase [Ferrimonas sediminicola]